MSDEDVLVQNEEITVRKSWWRHISLEPVMVLLYFSVTLTGAVFSNVLVYRTCYITLKYNETDCALLGTPNASISTQKLEAIVQPYAANFFMVQSIMESIPPALLSFFLGPWSDKYGRKPIILSSLIGYSLIYVTYLFILILGPDASPWWFSLSYIPLAFTGGQCALITGTFGYLTDTTKEDDRATRMSIMEAAVYLGLLVGTLSGSPIYNRYGALVVFGIATGSTVLAVIYTWLAMKETVRDIPQHQSKLLALFDLSLVSDMFKVCVKPRAGYSRCIIWMVMGTLGTSILVLIGNSTVNYLFVREQLQWTLDDYTRFNSVSIILSIVGTVCGVYVLNKLFGMSEAILAIIALVSGIAEALIKAWATISWHMYLAASVSLFRGVFGPMARAIQSRVVLKTEIGKVYSLTTSIEAITPLIASPIYTSLYKTTLAVFPGAYHLLTAAIYLGTTFVFGVVYVLFRKFPVHLHDDVTITDNEYAINKPED